MYRWRSLHLALFSLPVSTDHRIRFDYPLTINEIRSDKMRPQMEKVRAFTEDMSGSSCSDESSETISECLDSDNKSTTFTSDKLNWLTEKLEDLTSKLQFMQDKHQTFQAENQRLQKEIQRLQKRADPRMEDLGFDRIWMRDRILAAYAVAFGTYWFIRGLAYL